MILKAQKRIAASLMKGSRKRVRFDVSRLDEIKEAITKADIKGLIADRAITITKKRGVSKARARKRQIQRAKGKRKGPGSRKGTRNAREKGKTAWMNKARSQRETLKGLKEKSLVSTENYRQLYRKVKGGFFRSVRHLKLYMQEHELFEKRAERKGGGAKAPPAKKA
ncbi:50S ribosomal protein L19e [Candidatus Woesearchaeota archaeon]|nr:50S ribosomal protein L19e [Candidatus Woesearchaeota archaeon]